MNNEPEAVPVEPVKTDTLDDQKKQKLIHLVKKGLIYLVILVALVLGGIFGVRYLIKYESQKKIEIDQQIGETVYNLRDDLVAYYEKNQSYSGWKANEEAGLKVQKMGSQINVSISNSQSYMIYAWLPVEKQYLCVDHTGFTDLVSKVEQTQAKCQ